MANVATDGQKEAVKTYIEQTKLLVTLASAFIFAPAGLVTIMKDRIAASMSKNDVLYSMVGCDMLFIASVLCGYVVLGSLAGSQNSNQFDVFRPATRVASVLQLCTYLAGLVIFIVLSVRILG